MNLLIYTPDDRFLEGIRYYLKREGISFSLLEKKEQLAECDTLLLFSPIPHYDRYLAIDSLWKTFLQKNYPDIKLISAGFKNETAPNYIDLFQLPESFEKFISYARKAGEDWTPVPTDAPALSDVMQKFLNGHGKKSIVKALANAHSKMDRILKEMDTPNLEAYARAIKYFKNHPKQPLQSLKAIWYELKRRWENFAPYVQYLPKNHEFKEIDTCIRSINPYFENFDGQLFFDLKCPEKLKTIFSLIKSIESNYVSKTASNTAS